MTLYFQIMVLLSIPLFGGAKSLFWDARPTSPYFEMLWQYFDVQFIFFITFWELFYKFRFLLTGSVMDSNTNCLKHDKSVKTLVLEHIIIPGKINVKSKRVKCTWEKDTGALLAARLYCRFTDLRIKCSSDRGRACEHVDSQQKWSGDGLERVLFTKARGSGTSCSCHVNQLGEQGRE